jgi:hypothetical protein
MFFVQFIPHVNPNSSEEEDTPHHAPQDKQDEQINQDMKNGKWIISVTVSPTTVITSKRVKQTSK